MKKFILFLVLMLVLMPSYSFGEGTDGASTNQKIVTDEIINRVVAF